MDYRLVLIEHIVQYSQIIQLKVHSMFGTWIFECLSWDWVESNFK